MSDSLGELYCLL